MEDPINSSARLRVEYWSVDRLKPYERNPRKNDNAVDQIRTSIREFGFAVPMDSDSVSRTLQKVCTTFGTSVRYFRRVKTPPYFSTETFRPKEDFYKTDVADS